MCYRCQVCSKVSQPGQARLVRVTTRKIPAKRTERYKTPNGTSFRLVENGTRTEIAREVLVCQTCKELLSRGISAKQIRLICLKARVMRSNQPMAQSVPNPTAVNL